MSTDRWYHLKKLFALFPGGERPTSAHFLEDHYRKVQARRSPARHYLDRSLAALLHTLIPLRAARTGVVTLIQRFGSALNLNVHLHMLILDGVYTQEVHGPRFHHVSAPDAKSLERLLNRLVQRIIRRLSRDGLLIEDADQSPAQLGLNLEPADPLDQLNAASIRYRIAVGQGAGGRTLTLKNPALTRTDSTPKPFTANLDSFSLNCAVSCQPHQRDRLEQLCRYITRPALCLDRLSVNTTGQVVYQLKNPFHDGTSHVLFSPADFIARLAALVPRPRASISLGIAASLCT